MGVPGAKPPLAAAAAAESLAAATLSRCSVLASSSDDQAVPATAVAVGVAWKYPARWPAGSGAASSSSLRFRWAADAGLEWAAEGESDGDECTLLAVDDGRECRGLIASGSASSLAGLGWREWAVAVAERELLADAPWPSIGKTRALRARRDEAGPSAWVGMVRAEVDISPLGCRWRRVRVSANSQWSDPIARARGGVDRRKRQARQRREAGHTASAEYQTDQAAPTREQHATVCVKRSELARDVFAPVKGRPRETERATQPDCRARRRRSKRSNTLAESIGTHTARGLETI